MTRFLNVALPPPRATDTTLTNTVDLGLAIFLQDIPLLELIALRRICRQWKRVIEALCAQRRSLRLFGWLHTEEENDQLFGGPFYHHLDGQKVLFLTRLFPNIHSIGVFAMERYMVTVFLALLPRWSANLAKLSIRGLPKNKALESKLFQAIKSLPKLQALSLWDCSENLVPGQLPKRMVVLRQLDTFMLQSYTGDLTPILMQLGPSIENLFIASATPQAISLVTEPLANWLAVHKDVGAQLRYLDLQLTPDNGGALWKLICSHFIALEHLEVSFLFGQSFEETLPHLRQLPALYKLNINVNLRKLKHFEALDSIEPFTNIRILFLGAVADASFDLATFKRTIGRLFPALEELRIASFSPNFVDKLTAQVKSIFPNIQKHHIGLANRSKLKVKVKKQSYAEKKAIEQPDAEGRVQRQQTSDDEETSEIDLAMQFEEAVVM